LPQNIKVFKGNRFGVEEGGDLLLGHPHVGKMSNSLLSSHEEVAVGELHVCTGHLLGSQHGIGRIRFNFL
jgi:hypothetical protein